MTLKASTRLTGQAPTKSSQLAPAPPLISRTAPPSTPSSCIWIYPPTCPARMLAGTFRCNAASPVPTPTTMATCRSVCQRSKRNKCSTTSPINPPRTTLDDVSTPIQRVEVEKITGHQSVRGRGGVIAVMYETHWTGLSGPSWEREMHTLVVPHLCSCVEIGDSSFSFIPFLHDGRLSRGSYLALKPLVSHL